MQPAGRKDQTCRILCKHWDIFFQFRCNLIVFSNIIYKKSVIPFIQGVKGLGKGHMASQTAKQTREDDYLRKQQAHSMPKGRRARLVDVTT